MPMEVEQGWCFNEPNVTKWIRWINLIYYKNTVSKMADFLGRFVQLKTYRYLF